MLFRRRVWFGVVQKKRAKLAPVALADGRRVFALVGSDPDAIREHVESQGAEQ